MDKRYFEESYIFIEWKGEKQKNRFME